MRLPTAAKTRFMPIVSILAVAVGLLALAGCGGSSSTTSLGRHTVHTGGHPDDVEWDHVLDPSSGDGERVER